MNDILSHVLHLKAACNDEIKIYRETLVDYYDLSVSPLKQFEKLLSKMCENSDDDVSQTLWPLHSVLYNLLTQFDRKMFFAIQAIDDNIGNIVFDRPVIGTGCNHFEEVIMNVSLDPVRGKTNKQPKTEIKKNSGGQG
jgi:hypothetical protein